MFTSAMSCCASRSCRRHRVRSAKNWSSSASSKTASPSAWSKPSTTPSAWTPLTTSPAPKPPSGAGERESKNRIDSTAAFPYSGQGMMRTMSADRTNPPQQLVERVVRAIEKNADARLTLAALSAAVGASPPHLQRTFKRWMGVSPRQYQEARRLEGFKTRVRQGQGVTRALYEAGYGFAAGTLACRPHGAGGVHGQFG